MKRRRYKQYFEPNSSTYSIPRSTQIRYNEDALDATSAEPYVPDHGVHTVAGRPDYEGETTVIQGAEGSNGTGSLDMGIDSFYQGDVQEVRSFQEAYAEISSHLDCSGNDSDLSSGSEIHYNSDTAPEDGLSDGFLSDRGSEYDEYLAVEDDHFSNHSMSDSDSDNDEFHELNIDQSLNAPLSEGIQTTKAECIIMILSFVMRHKLSSAALADLLKMINEMLGREVIVSSTYLFKKIFGQHSPNLHFHFYCKYCFSLVASFDGDRPDEIMPCPHCQRPCNIKRLDDNFFLTTSLVSQVEGLLNRPDISSQLSYKEDRQKVHENNLEDIFDGLVYQELFNPGGPLHDTTNLTYTFNTDGMPIFSSSKCSLWPIYLIINELPPKTRKENMILAGVWFGKCEPKMNLFLSKFVQEANKLAVDGVNWMDEGLATNSKLYGVCCNVDAPAKALMQNVMQFNGYMGCGLCYHPGKAVDRVIKYPVNVCEYEDREDEDMLSDMRTALLQNRPFRGVKGPSPLINLTHFPIVWGFPPDFMHCVLLGVSRQLAELWFSDASTDHYIGSPANCNIISNCLKSMKTPSFVARTPRPVSERKFWKASEWYNWLLFFCLPCLTGILPPINFSHLCILVKAIHLLLQKSVSIDDVNEADVLLAVFVAKMQILYGEWAMSFNVHCLTHLAKSVKMWGPLWTHSCFPFENANGKIKGMLHGNKGIMAQAMYKFLLLRTLPVLKDTYRLSQRVQYFCDEILFSDNAFPTYVAENVQLYGVGKCFELPEAETNALINSGYDVDQNVVMYDRFSIKGLMFHSIHYTRSTKVDSSVFCYRNGRIGQIGRIMKTADDQCIILFKECVVRNDPRFKSSDGDNVDINTQINHVKLCNDIPSAFHVIPAKDISGSCFSFHVRGSHYVCIPPNYVSL